MQYLTDTQLCYEVKGKCRIANFAFIDIAKYWFESKIPGNLLTYENHTFKAILWTQTLSIQYQVQWESATQREEHSMYSEQCEDFWLFHCLSASVVLELLPVPIRR
jgi:hypothetical protein